MCRWVVGEERAAFSLANVRSIRRDLPGVKEWCPRGCMPWATTGAVVVEERGSLYSSVALGAFPVGSPATRRVVGWAVCEGVAEIAKCFMLDTCASRWWSVGAASSIARCRSAAADSVGIADNRSVLRELVAPALWPFALPTTATLAEEASEPAYTTAVEEAGEAAAVACAKACVVGWARVGGPAVVVASELAFWLAGRGCDVAAAGCWAAAAVGCGLAGVVWPVAQPRSSCW